MEVKKRDPYFDNAKCILILLVVFGHFIEPMNRNIMLKNIFIFIYLFHMPAFIFISGYFSKPKLIKDKRIIKFLVLYTIFQLIFVAFNNFIGLDIRKYDLLVPTYVYWYIFAMVVWNIFIKIFIALKINMKYLFQGVDKVDTFSFS